MSTDIPFDQSDVDRYWRTVSGLHPFAVRRRVLHIAAAGHDGIARYVSEASSFQAAGGWEVHVASAVGAAAGDGTRCHRWADDDDGSGGTLAQSRQLRRIVSDVDPEVVVLHGGRAGLLGRALLRGELPTVYLPHVWPFISLPTVWAAAAARWERQAARWTNLIVVVSDAQASTTVKNAINAPLAMVHNPVPQGWSLQSPADRAAARARLGLGPQPLAVSLGRLTKQKGHDQLLAAWSTVATEVPAARLAIVGGGPLQDQLARLRTPGATFVGEVADPRDWISAADVVVLSSRWEGMSLAMLEALASGRSVVTTAVAGSEVVAKADAGAVVPLGNTRDLAGAVARRLTGGADNDVEGRRGAAHVAMFNDRVGCLLRLSAYISRAHVFGAPAARS